MIMIKIRANIKKMRKIEFKINLATEECVIKH